MPREWPKKWQKGQKKKKKKRKEKKVATLDAELNWDAKLFSTLLVCVCVCVLCGGGTDKVTPSGSVPGAHDVLGTNKMF